MPEVVGSDVVLVTASVDGRSRARRGVRGADRVGRRHRRAGDRPSTAPASRPRVTLDGAPGWRLGDGATRPTRSRCTVDRMAVAARDRRCRRRGTRARARGRVREGAGAVRQADRLVPGGPAPLRRHAARGRARARRGLLRVLGRRRRRPGRGAPRRDDGQGVRERRVPAARRRARSRCSAASASRGSTTSTCTTSACSRSRRTWARPTTRSTSWRRSCSRPRAVTRLTAVDPDQWRKSL